MYENGKMRHIESIPGMGGDKGEWGRWWIQLCYIVRTFVNVIIYISTIIIIIKENNFNF
jgi:hypothetical protein